MHLFLTLYVLLFVLYPLEYTQKFQALSIFFFQIFHTLFAVTIDSFNVIAIDSFPFFIYQYTSTNKAQSCTDRPSPGDEPFIYQCLDNNAQISCRFVKPVTQIARVGKPLPYSRSYPCRRRMEAKGCPRSHKTDYALDQFATTHYLGLIYIKGDSVTPAVGFHKVRGKMFWMVITRCSAKLSFVI